MKAEALVMLVMVRAGLRFMPYIRLLSWLGRCERRFARTPQPVSDVTRAVVAAGHRLTGTTCLAEALVAYTMLRRRGHAPLLRIGVKPHESSILQAHAWIECDGIVVLGHVPQMDGYAILA